MLTVPAVFRACSMRWGADLCHDVFLPRAVHCLILLDQVEPQPALRSPYVHACMTLEHVHRHAMVLLSLWCVGAGHASLLARSMG